MMAGKWVPMLVVMILLAGCGGKAATPPDPPKPTQVLLEIQTSGDLNPNAEGRPSPLVVRFYELRSLANFGSADFISLYDKDRNVLGADLIKKHEFILQPNATKTLRLVLPDDTRAIGGFAAFRNFEQAHWRASANIRAHEFVVIRVRADANNLDMHY